MPDISILIKPCGGHCNLNCTYCFYRALVEEQEHNQSCFISQDTMENIIVKAIQCADKNVYLAFQGGEPTLIGKEFYRHLPELIKKHNNKNITFHYAIQTNGILIDDEWCEILKRDNYLVGLSIDGLESIHNLYRQTHTGKETYSKVIDALNLFKQYDINFNVLTVVTNKLCGHAKEMFSNMQTLGVEYIQLLECLDPLKTGPYANEYSLSEEEYGQFLIDLFDEWKQCLGKSNFIHINYFENLLALLLGQSPSDCGMYGYCSSQFVVEADGNVYPCDFYVLPKYLIGNVNVDSFEEMKKRKITKEFESQSFELDYSCGECRYIKLCRGGCRRSRERVNSLSKTFLCKGIKHFLDNRLDELVSIAKEVAKGNYRTIK